MRTSARLCFLALALCVPNVSAAEAPRNQIAIPEFSGSKGAVCRAAFERLVSERGLRLAELGPDMSRPPDVQDFSAVSEWLETQQSVWPRAGLVILGSAHGERLVLGVYSLPDPALVGLKTFPIEDGCRLDERGELIVGAWFEALATDGASPPRPTTPAPGGVEVRPPTSAWSRARQPDAPNLSGEDPLFPTRAAKDDPYPLPKGANKQKAAPTVSDSRRAESRRLFRVGAPEWVGLSAEMKAVTRSFQYLHLPGSDLRGYELDLAPALGLRALVHPLAALDPPWLRGFGLQLDYWGAIGLTSERTEGGPALPTDLAELELAARYDWDGGHFLPGLRVSALFGFHQLHFSIGSAEGQSESELPNVRYQSLRMGAAGAIPIGGKVVINVDAAYLLLLSTGGDLESAPFFEEASGFGFDLTAGIEYQFDPIWSLHASAEFLSYAIDLAPTSRGAVGVDEEIIAMSVGVRVRY